MRVAIHQPNYIPWCGYFAKMKACDVFVFLDDVQMPVGRSYVYRSQIQVGENAQWLSVPTQNATGEPISAVRFADARWTKKHLGTLRGSYGRCAHFKEVFGWLEPIYLSAGDHLADFNIRLICAIATYLNLTCRFEVSSTLQPQGTSDDRLISLAQLVGADTYVSGKGGQNYQDPAKFAAANLSLEVRQYVPLVYEQNSKAFVPGLSILDALFHLGREAVEVLDYPAITSESAEVAAQTEETPAWINEGQEE